MDEMAIANVDSALAPLDTYDFLRAVLNKLESLNGKDPCAALCVIHHMAAHWQIWPSRPQL